MTLDATIITPIEPLGPPVYKPPPFVVQELLSPLEASERVHWHISDFGILPVFAKGHKGAGIRVGVIDTGVDTNHLTVGDLKGQVTESRDFTGSRHGVHDSFGHGTHVAGIIGAVQGNDRGTVGVAPDCKLYIAKALGDDGYGTSEQIVAAIDWLISCKVHIINMSLGSSQRDNAILAAIDRATQAGIIIICAAGNDGPDGSSWPAEYPSVVSVGAIDRNRRAAPFSSPSSVDIAAPGVEVISTYKNGAYASLSGTSMASPWVTGVVVLRMSAELATFNEIKTNPTNVLKLLEAHAVDVGDTGPDPITGPGLVLGEDFIKDVIATPVPPIKPPQGEVCGKIIVGPFWGTAWISVTTPAA